MRLQVSLTLPREAVSVPLVRHLVGATLERAGVTDACVDDVKVAVSEACTNAYQHSVAGDTYEVVVTLDDEAVAIDVIDRGEGIRVVPVEEAVPVVDAHDESGRGIDLIRALTESARFDTVSDEGGAVRMWKRLEWQPGAPWPSGPPSGDEPPADGS